MSKQLIEQIKEQINKQATNEDWADKIKRDKQHKTITQNKINVFINKQKKVQKIQQRKRLYKINKCANK